MSTPTPFFHCQVSDQPIVHRVFPNVAFQPHSLRDADDNIIIKVNISVRFARRRNGRNEIVHHLTQLSSHYISRKQFLHFQYGPAFLRRKLSHHLLNPTCINLQVPSMISDARRLFFKKHPPRPPRLPSSNANAFVLYHLFVDVVAEFPEIEEVEVTASSDRIMGENLHDDDTQEKRWCIICFQDLRDDMEVSEMPCLHIYHNDCIVQWLKISHSCPLCRYPMPVD